MNHVVLWPFKACQGTFMLDPARVRSSELVTEVVPRHLRAVVALLLARGLHPIIVGDRWYACAPFLARLADVEAATRRSEEHTSELQSHSDLVCRLLLEKKKKK